MIKKMSWASFVRGVAAILLLGGSAWAQNDGCHLPSYFMDTTYSNSCIAPPGGMCPHTMNRTLTINWNRTPYANGHYSQFLTGSVGRIDRIVSPCNKVEGNAECGYYSYPIHLRLGGFTLPGNYGAVKGTNIAYCQARGDPAPPAVLYRDSLICGKGADKTLDDSIPCPPECPVLVDLGDGFRLTDIKGGVIFDLNADGWGEQTSWTAAGANVGFLVLDRNGNGVIDNGSELFGNFTAQAASGAPNGFLALAEFDRQENGGNGDGIIDYRDAVYQQLGIWVDVNHNGISEPGEIRTLAAAGIVGIDLNYRESRWEDQYGNEFKFRAKVYGDKWHDLGRWAYDVFLKTAP